MRKGRIGLFGLLLAAALLAGGAAACPVTAHAKNTGKAPAKKPGAVKAAPALDPVDANRPARPCYALSPAGLGRRCEPQSLPYGRCRTGNMTCRGNYELSPVGWYRCAEKNGHVSAVPRDMSILILGDNSRHRMPTGHVFVVERCRDLGGGRWELTLSHTNHDRRCSLETGVSATYDQNRRVLAMNTGRWSAWGKNLSALGFILQDPLRTAARR